MEVNKFAEYILLEGYKIPGYEELRRQTILEHIQDFLLD
tara:strand:+ start:293 stop:409 length:117 start_codon:yes stop_codon:yes gene_type:complete